MKWETIAKILNCTSKVKMFFLQINCWISVQYFCFVGNEAKKRWDSLRSQFRRKLRQQKTVPSGSGSTIQWPLMSCMSFLKSYIQNRKYVYSGSFKKYMIIQ